MIVSIESSLSTFKAVHFQEGLNVLLADAQPGSTEKQTRNSAGKTSLVEIIHFLMGSNCDKDSLFRTPGLIEHTFTGSFMIGGEHSRFNAGALSRRRYSCFPAVKSGTIFRRGRTKR